MRSLVITALLIGTFSTAVESSETTAEPTIWEASRDYDEWEERWKDPVVKTEHVRSRSHSHLLLWTWFYGNDQLTLMVIENSSRTSEVANARFQWENEEGVSRELISYEIAPLASDAVILVLSNESKDFLQNFLKENLNTTISVQLRMSNGDVVTADFPTAGAKEALETAEDFLTNQ